MIINDLFNNKKTAVAEGRFVRGPGGVPLDRQGRPVAPKAPKAETMTMRQWVVHHEGQRGEGGEMIIDAPNLETAWELANEYDLDIIDIKPAKGVSEGSKMARADKSAKAPKPEDQQEYDAVEKYRKDLAQSYNKEPDFGIKDDEEENKWWIDYDLDEGVAEGSLEEVSQQTLQSYRKKASAQKRAADDVVSGNADDETWKKNVSLSAKRRQGIDAANKRLGVAEGFSLKKTNVDKYMEPGDPDEYTQDVNIKDTDYEIINNKTGQVVGTASWTTNDFMGPGALKITMKNGATRWLDIWASEQGNPQSAFNRFVKDPKTAKKYKEQGMAEGSVDHWSPMGKDSIHQDRIRSLQNLIAIAKEQGRQLRVQELELALKKLQGVSEDNAGVPVHRIGLTVTDPNHPMVSKRGETIQKTVRVPGADREKAINSAIAHYRRKGYKVHDHHYIGTVDQEPVNELDKKTVASWVRQQPERIKGDTGLSRTDFKKAKRLVDKSIPSAIAKYKDPGYGKQEPRLEENMADDMAAMAQKKFPNAYISKDGQEVQKPENWGKKYVPPTAASADLEKQQRDLTAKYPNIDELVRRAELNRDPDYEMADGQAYYAARDAEQNYQKLRQIQRVIQGLNESLDRSHLP